VVQEPVAGVEACYLRRLWEAEHVRLPAAAESAGRPTDVGRQADRAVDDIQRAQGITYAPQQRRAVEAAARSGVLILTGGPGTGKTTTVRGIVALFERMGLEVVLSAPTGRAAKRLGELTGREAQTVHRLLGMSWNEASREVTFTKTEREPLEADAVVVDEMSMVDLPLFAALLRALRPGTRLVMVGDADQLPSVGAGNVFSDLIRSGRGGDRVSCGRCSARRSSPPSSATPTPSTGAAAPVCQRPAGLLLPLPPGGRAGRVHGGGAVQDPPAGEAGRPRRSDSGADAHPPGPGGHPVASTGCCRPP
jgi:hypothetical protein